MKRFFEMVPGILAWLTLIFMFLFSWLLPVWVSIFIILFDIYWVLKTVYLSLHLRATFSEMRRVMKIDWLAEIRGEFPEGDALVAAGTANKTRPSLAEIYHLVILPMYDEPYEVVRETFRIAHARQLRPEKIIGGARAGGSGGGCGARDGGTLAA